MKKLLAITLTLVMLLGALSTVTLSASAEGTESTAWDGSTATAPEGSGTKDDPYLISSGANLRWMSNQINNQTQGQKLLLEGYFEQTCDIDLGGNTFGSIGCYVNENFIGNVTETDSAKQTVNAFAGTYNGNGYVIKNATVGNRNKGTTEKNDNLNWPTGFFGVVWGATIENVVLDNITVTSGTGHIGGLVGLALSPETITTGEGDNAVTETTPVGFNTIRNCVLTDTCKVIGTAIASTAAGKFYGHREAARIGGIVGIGTNIKIENCVNNADLTSNYAKNHPIMGGIAAQLGYGATVTNCVNNGDMLIDYSSKEYNTNNGMHHVGGIVGLISSMSGTWAYTKLTKESAISECYNTGVLTVKAPTDVTLPLSISKNDLQWGGIAGTIYGTTQSVTVSNCYNLAASCNHTDLAWKGNDVNAAGILGQGRDMSGKAILTNCYSVSVTNGSTDYDASDNWYNNGVYGYGYDAVTATNVSTTEADEIKVYTDAIDAQIVKNQINGRNSVEYIGVQKHTEDNRVRVLAGIEDLDVKYVGFEAEITESTTAELVGKKLDKSTQIVYTGIYATVNNVPNTLVEASAKNTGYFVTIVLDLDGFTGTISGRFYSVNKAGVKVYGSDAKDFVFADGVLTQPADNTNS